MKPDLSDVLIIVGLALLLVGVWKLHPALSLIVGGAIVAMIGVRVPGAKRNV